METWIHVIGTGTIGEPLSCLLANLKEKLGIDIVTVHKHSPKIADRPKINGILARGAKLVVDADKLDDFNELGMHVSYTTEEAMERATVVIDCTPIGNKMKADVYSKYEHKVKGFIAQGSEFGFGKMYARGINDEVLVPGEDKYIQVVSCNTHNISCLINTVALQTSADNLESGRFLCIRRANDIGQDAGFIPSPQVGKHDDAEFGTHHARDAFHLFQTKNLSLNLFSSALKLNTQYMHTLQFHLKVKEAITKEEVIDRLQHDDRIAVTEKTSANAVFSFGRDHGFYGRILNQTVIPTNTLHVSEDGYDITGFCFTPQDGNSLLSSLAAALWFVDPNTYEEKMQVVQPFFFQEV